MDSKLSMRTIEALAQVISGGSANDTSPSIGHYRSGPKIEQFMRRCNIELTIGSSSRVPTLTHALLETNDGSVSGRNTLFKIIEQATDPRDFANDPNKLEAVVGYVNSYLEDDGYTVQRQGQHNKVTQKGTTTAVVGELTTKAVVINFDTVNLDLQRALENAERDPEDAVTGACSTLESVFRSVLIELDIEPPAKKDISGLYKAVRGPLGLGPDRADLPADIAADVRGVMSGLITTVESIGALRTHGGDAHGKQRGSVRMDARIARLAIHAASTVSLFVIETWQKKFPAKELTRVD